MKAKTPHNDNDGTTAELARKIKQIQRDNMLSPEEIEQLREQSREAGKAMLKHLLGGTITNRTVIRPGELTQEDIADIMASKVPRKRTQPKKEHKARQPRQTSGRAKTIKAGELTDKGAELLANSKLPEK